MDKEKIEKEGLEGVEGLSEIDEDLEVEAELEEEEFVR